MKYSKYKLGELIKLSDKKNKNEEYNLNAVRGISIKKDFIYTKANMNNVSLKPYLLVEPNYFAYVPTTSRNGEKITIAFNDTNETYIVSSSYIVFYVDSDLLVPEYLFMYFNRPEFDRYARYNSWGSVRETFSWKEMCDIDIFLPPRDIQENYIKIYNDINKKINNSEEEYLNLKRVLDLIVDKEIHTGSKVPIGDFIEQTDEQNKNNQFNKNNVMGMTITKEIIPTKANLSTTDISNFKIVHTKEFVYNPRTHGKKIGLGFNDTDNPILISWNNTSFRIKEEKKQVLLPEFLYMCFSRNEWDREACFRSWGSSTEVFSWDALSEIKITIPNIKVQESISNIFYVMKKKKNIHEKLLNIKKDFCSVVISNSLRGE